MNTLHCFYCGDELPLEEFDLALTGAAICQTCRKGNPDQNQPPRAVQCTHCERWFPRGERVLLRDRSGRDLNFCRRTCRRDFERAQAEAHRREIGRVAEIRRRSRMKEFRAMVPSLYLDTRMRQLPHPGLSVEAIRNVTDCPHYTITGPPGTGKSRTAYVIARRQVALRGWAGAWRNGSELTMELAREAAEFDGTLVLDDFDSNKGEQWARATYHLLENRLHNELPTIVTTNALTRNQLEDRFGQTFAEKILRRLNELTQVVTIAP